MNDQTRRAPEFDPEPGGGVFSDVNLSSGKVRLTVGGGIRQAPAPLVGAAAFFIACVVAMVWWPRHAIVAFPVLSLAGALFALKALACAARRVVFSLAGDRLDVSKRYSWLLPLETERERYEPLDDVTLAKVAPGEGWMHLPLDEAEKLAAAGRPTRVCGIVISSGNRSRHLSLPLTFDETLWLTRVLKTGLTSTSTRP